MVVAVASVDTSLSPSNIYNKVKIFWESHKNVAHFSPLFWQLSNTVKLGDKEQIGVKELFTDYQPFNTHKSTVRLGTFVNLENAKTWC
jgi:hypothetical protein